MLLLNPSSLFKQGNQSGSYRDVRVRGIQYAF